MRGEGQQWSGEATRNQGFAVEETRVDINIGGDDVPDTVAERKARPIWMTESTVITEDNTDNTDAILNEAAQNSQQPSLSSWSSSATTTTTTTANNNRKKEQEDIMAVLLQYEKQPEQNKKNHLKGLRFGSSNANSSDSSDAENDIDNTKIRKFLRKLEYISLCFLIFICLSLANTDDYNNFINSESEEEEDDVPSVLVAGRPHPIDQINDVLIAQMSQQEKENYIHIYQQHYSHIYD